MNFKASFLPYVQTGYFSKIVLDYINRETEILPFYQYPVSIEGLKASIQARKKFATDRTLLVSVLQKQYSVVTTSTIVTDNIQLLQHENTFTICTAHQPNIFTGPLYFIYKILHVVKLAEHLKISMPGNNFVPVYYMGSEDADLEELGHIYINGEKQEWVTDQTGAVGRMKVDKALVQLIDRFSGQLTVYPFGEEIIALMKACYRDGITVEQATFNLVNKLFAEYGVVVLLPDNAALKAAFAGVIEKELVSAFSHAAVQETVKKFPPDYKVQASGRELNLFYLTEGQRGRIEMKTGNQMATRWVVMDTDLEFTKDELMAELKAHPERFSPNVILRPVYQEWILPNIAFIGGGGEIAYWLQLKKVFEAVGTSYPLLVLRNSFMLVEEEVRLLTDKLKLTYAGLFKAEPDIMNYLVCRDSLQQVNLEQEKLELTTFYEHLKGVAGKIDTTLQRHTEALQAQALKKIATLEKKMLRAEKKKFEAQKRQLHRLKSQLFPGNNLQERGDNMMTYYAKWGGGFIRMLYENSNALEMEFGVLAEEKIS